MSGDKMEVELAEQKLKTMEHSEQHYFKRYGFFFFSFSYLGRKANIVRVFFFFLLSAWLGELVVLGCSNANLVSWHLVTIIMVRIYDKKNQDFTGEFVV